MPLQALSLSRPAMVAPGGEGGQITPRALGGRAARIWAHSGARQQATRRPSSAGSSWFASQTARPGCCGTTRRGRAGRGSDRCFLRAPNCSSGWASHSRTPESPACASTRSARRRPPTDVRPSRPAAFAPTLAARSVEGRAEGRGGPGLRRALRTPRVFTRRRAASAPVACRFEARFTHSVARTTGFPRVPVLQGSVCTQRRTLSQPEQTSVLHQPHRAHGSSGVHGPKSSRSYRTTVTAVTPLTATAITSWGSTQTAPLQVVSGMGGVSGRVLYRPSARR